MRQQLLDRHVLAAAIRRRAVAAEEAGQRIAQRRGEGEPAVADQRRDADAGDRLRHAADQRRRVRIGVVTLEKHRLAVPAHGRDRGRRTMLRDPGVERLAVSIRRVAARASSAALADCSAIAVATGSTDANVWLSRVIEGLPAFLASGNVALTSRTTQHDT